VGSGDDRLELTAGFAHLGDRTIGFLPEDRDAAAAQRVDLVVITVTVGIAQLGEDVEAAEFSVSLQRGGVGERGGIERHRTEARDIGVLDAAADTRVAFVGSDEIRHAADCEAGEGVRLEHAEYRGVLDMDAAVTIARVESVAGKAAVDEAERLDRNRAVCVGVGQVEHRHCVDFLQRDVSARAVWRDGDVFRLDIGCRLETGIERQALREQRAFRTVERLERERVADGCCRSAARQVDHRDRAVGIVGDRDRLGLVGDEEHRAIGVERDLIGQNAHFDDIEKRMASRVEQRDVTGFSRRRIAIGDRDHAVFHRD